MSERLPPSETRRLITGFILSHPDGVTSAMLDQEGFNGKWSRIVDPLSYALNHLRVLGFARFDRESCRIIPLVSSTEPGK